MSVRTLTRRFLHWSQPLRDLVWALRGRMLGYSLGHVLQSTFKWSQEQSSSSTKYGVVEYGVDEE